jgi:hypothetical protein
MFVDQSRTRADRVGEMLRRRVERADRRGDPALRPARVAVVDAALGEDEDGAELAGFRATKRPEMPLPMTMAL